MFPGLPQIAAGSESGVVLPVPWSPGWLTSRLPMGMHSCEEVLSSQLNACSPTHSSEVVSYKGDSLAITKVNRAMAIHSNPGTHCNKERQMSARKNPRAILSDP
jgi:hypothetical protein